MNRVLEHGRGQCPHRAARCSAAPSRCALALLCLVLTQFGCAAEFAETTQIVLEVRSAFPSDNLLERVEVRVDGPTATEVATGDIGAGALAFPVTLGIVPPPNELDARIQVHVRGGLLLGAIEQSVTTRFRPHESRLLVLELHPACLVRTCEAAGLACYRGTCIDSEIDLATEPIWDSE